jgi:phosphoheptose isomerase
MLKSYLQESIALDKKIIADKTILAMFDKIVDAALVVLKSGKKITAAENGGSAADVQHFAKHRS